MNLARCSPPWLPLIVLLCLLGSALLACGSTIAPPAEGPTPTVTVPLEMPVVIAMAGRFSGQDLVALEELIARFEAANPDARIELVDVRGNADRRHQIMAEWLSQGDSSVDVYVLDNTWLAELTSAGHLRPLDDYVESYGVDRGAFLPPTIQASTIGGRLMALPWTTSSGLLYYRADLLDKYGDRPATDWVGWQRIALDIKAQEDLPAGFVWQGQTPENLVCNTLEFVWAYGGGVLDDSGEVVFDSQQTRAALQQMRDLITSGASPAEIVDYAESPSFRVFESGEAVLLRHWAGAWRLLNDKDSPLAGRVGLVPLPASCLTGQGLALSAYSLYPDQAFRWMAFLTGQEQQVYWALATSYLPTLQTAYLDTDMLASQPFIADLPAALSAARPLPQTEVYAALAETISRNVHELLTGTQDAATTAGQIQHDIEAALRSFQGLSENALRQK